MFLVLLLIFSNGLRICKRLLYYHYTEGATDIYGMCFIFESSTIFETLFEGWMWYYIQK